MLTPSGTNGCHILKSTPTVLRAQRGAFPGQGRNLVSLPISAPPHQPPKCQQIIFNLLGASRPKWPSCIENNVHTEGFHLINLWHHDDEMTHTFAGQFLRLLGVPALNGDNKNSIGKCLTALSLAVSNSLCGDIASRGSECSPAWCLHACALHSHPSLGSNWMKLEQ